MIRQITWFQIRKIWESKLWPQRTTAIEPTSAMCFMSGYNITNMNYEPTFFGYFLNNKIVGVNSGHLCADNSYRSRGLWVHTDYRGNGFGRQLLEAVIDQGKLESANYIWSFPRKTSWSTYKAVSFKRTSNWHQSETSEANAFCRKDL